MRPARAWSGALKPDPKIGKLPPVGNTVNVSEAAYSTPIGYVLK